MKKKIALQDFSNVEQMLYRALQTRIDLERAQGSPVRDMYLQPDLYQVYDGIKKRCEDLLESPVGYVFDGVHIHKGSIVQKEPLTVGTPWANTYGGRQEQRDKLKMVQLN